MKDKMLTGKLILLYGAFHFKISEQLWEDILYKQHHCPSKYKVENTLLHGFFLKKTLNSSIAARLLLSNAERIYKCT